MNDREPARAAAYRTRSLATWVSSAPPGVGMTVYCCGPDEAALFRELAPHFGVRPAITSAPVTEATVDLVGSNRCISVGHASEITDSTLLALSRAGVRYISTRSIGYNHLDVRHAEQLGITVENVVYSPAGVADYTVMLMLMVLRHAKTMIRRSDVHDYRLNETRGRELRDLTVGVIGTGRIGAAVIDRLRGFGCQLLAYDKEPRTSARYVTLGELLQLSDVVTLHTPLTPETHHLLDRDRIERLPPGAVVVNTGRGALIDTAALVPALESGRLGGAALDVLEGEEGIFYTDHRDHPVESSHLLRLQQLPSVVVSPHTAYYTDHALSDLVENSIVNCLNFESRKQEWI